MPINIARREFVACLGGMAASGPFAASAQQLRRLRKIGVLMNGDATGQSFRENAAAFVEALRQLGWEDGKNAHIEIRWSSADADLAKTFAAELVALVPDVILAAGSKNLTMLRQATNSIPIVFVQVSDPVAQGFVQSLTQPGSNLTGFSAFEFSTGSKWIELLKEIAPALDHVTFMFNPDTSPQNEYQLRAVETASAALAVQIIEARVRSDADIEAAMEDLSRKPNSGLILSTDAFTGLRDTFISELALRYRLPTISGLSSSFARAGGLMYYGYTSSFEGQFRQAASYVDRILKGAHPSDLPVQLPTKYDLSINLRTAKALGLTVPQTLLVAADEVIE